ncbi:MAG: polysaccharide export protein [Desulfarculaceae bacterium]|nr:polysaccharide export protein [Desulfarculaceae bacterium]
MNLQRRLFDHKPSAPTAEPAKPTPPRPAVAQAKAPEAAPPASDKAKPQMAKPEPPKENPLTAAVAQEFEKARQMTVGEYIRTYGVPKAHADYKVGPQDVLNIRVFDEPELTREDLRVSSQGKITMPLIGPVKVDGLSPRQIETLLQIRYKQEGILKHPQISAHIKEFRGRWALILGAVNQPGRHPMEGNERLMEMLAKAGGIKFDAEGDIAANKIRILRRISGNGKDSNRDRVSMEIDLESMTRGDHPEYNLSMQHRDVIYVPEAARFFITGEVKSPGYYKIKDRDISVVEAITMAGGLTRIAAGNRTKLVRVKDGKEVTIKVPVDDILDGDKSADVDVQPDDVIVVPQSYF